MGPFLPLAWLTLVDLDSLTSIAVLAMSALLWDVGLIP